MAYPVSSPTADKSRGLAMDTRKRLEKCWTKELDWGLYPEYLKEVRCFFVIIHSVTLGLCSA